MKSQLKKKVVSERHLVLRMKRDLEKVLETVQPCLTKVQVLDIVLECVSKYADDVKFMLSRAEKLLALADINIFKFDCFRRQYENLRSRFHDKVRGVISLLQGTPRPSAGCWARCRVVRGRTGLWEAGPTRVATGQPGGPLVAP